MHLLSSTPRAAWLRSAGALAVLAAAAACSGGDAVAPSAPGAPVPSTASLRLVASSAPVAGQPVALAVELRGSAADVPVGVQGYLRYDASRLTFAGQADADPNFVVVNDQKAAQGELRVLAINPRALGERALTLVFEAKAADALAGARFEPETVALYSSAEAQAAPVQVSTGRFDVPAAHVFTDADSRAAVLRVVGQRNTGGVAGGVLARPGDAAVWGDVVTDGTVNAIDVQQLGRAAAGLNNLVQGNRDFAFAGNALPYNTGTPCRPGTICTAGVETAPGQVDAIDVSQLSQFAAGISRPVWGTPIRTAPSNRVIVSTDITANTTWTTGNTYELTGIIRVRNGAALTIQPGVVVEGRRGTANVSAEITALYVERDGQIFANGTAQAPIVFTCTEFSRVPGTPAGTFETTPSPRFKGCWGGVYIAGNAPINSRQGAAGSTASPAIAGRSTGGCNQQRGEGDAPLFGGCNPDDNSGVVRYARFEYGGFLLAANNELNNFTLGGVGRGTTIEYVQAHGGLDDGIELFGGTVNLGYLYMTANSDDSFDGAQGWIGTAHSGIIQMDPADGDKGLEMDNTEVVATYQPATNPQGGLFADPEGAPITRPTITNFTLVGARGDAIVSGNAVNDALHFRRGYQGIHRNFLIVAFPSVLDIDDAATITTNGTLAANCSLNGTNGLTGLAVSNSVLELNAALGNPDASDPAQCSGQGTIPAYTGTDLESVFLNAVASVTSTTASGLNVAQTGGVEAVNNVFDKISPDFRPSDAGAAATGAAPVPAGVPAALATFRGAVPPVGSVPGQVAWYMGWTRGWQSATAP